jgi:hypothetical protein
MASGVAQSVLREMGEQIWYGVSNDALGFPGLKAATVKGATTLSGNAVTIDATGSTSGAASSVYAVKFGEESVSLVGGMGKTLELGEWGEQLIDPAGDGKLFNAYVSSLEAWVGLQVLDEECVKRILNLTTDSGKGLTDALMNQLEAAFPVGYMPDAYFMSRRSRMQLQNSRTVALYGIGSNRPNQPLVAPLPTEFNGVPIIVTDCILNTDATE